MTEMDAGARAWLITVAVDHYWRVADWYELDDLIQDGIACWYRVVKKYETDRGRVRTRGHIMRLFKRAFLNDIHDLSKRATRNRVEGKADDVRSVRRSGRGGRDMVAGRADVWGMIAAPYDQGEYAQLIAEAPRMLQPLLRILLSEEPSPRLASRYRIARDGTRDTLNAKLCRMVGADPEIDDLLGGLRSYLEECILDARGWRLR